MAPSSLPPAHRRILPLLLLAAACAPDRPLATADPYARGYTDADFPRVQEIAPGVYTYEQLRAAGAERFTTVSMFVVTDEGVLVADGQGSPEETRRLVDAIGGITEHPVTRVVIGSDHGDHTAGNAAFPREAVFIAHPASVTTLRAAGASGDGDEDGWLPARFEEVSDRLAFTMGGRRVEVLFLGRAHTGGDLVVYLPDDGVVFMSEAYLHRVFPAMRSAFPSEWVSMLEAAQKLDAEIYVPGHGFVDSPRILREELQVFRRAVETVIAEGTRLHAAGYSLEEAQGRAHFGDLETWSLRESQGGRALQRVYGELDGEFR